MGHPVPSLWKRILYVDWKHIKPFSRSYWKLLYWNIGLAKKIVFLKNDIIRFFKKLFDSSHVLTGLCLIILLLFSLRFRFELSKMSKFFTNIWTSIIEYETPRLVKIHNRKLGLARRIIQLSIVAYVLVYALWLQKGYQEFTRVESSVTVKIKGITKSELGDGTNLDQSK